MIPKPLPKRPSLNLERSLWANGALWIAGIDEAGRGAWAGPVVAAAVILPPDDFALPYQLDGVRDSKTISPRQREKLFGLIYAVALAVGVGVGSHACIDRRGIIAATRHAMAQAVRHLSVSPQYLLIDHLSLPQFNIPQHAFPKADATSLSVAAASIIAKVTRDKLMRQLDTVYPGYNFARHKGYGTKAHRRALARLGMCKIHRHSFKIM
jgi:ribonuclease HII